MSIDYGEKERQFLATLKADTGRDLDEWLAAIAAEGLTERNTIIDWLRRQGFMFSKASWIERIHNNGGRPVYAGARAGTRRVRPEPRRRLPPAFAPAQPPAKSPAPTRPTPAPISPPRAEHTGTAEALPAATLENLDTLLARAKAYRPLANFVIAEIRKTVPGVAIAARDGFLTFQTERRAFALLTVTARELRLALAISSPSPSLALEPARFTPALKGAPPVTHMAVLTDARQITPALMAAVAQASKHG